MPNPKSCRLETPANNKPNGTTVQPPPRWVMADKGPLPQERESSPGGILNLRAGGLEVYQLLMVIDFCNNPTLLLETM